MSFYNQKKLGEIKSSLKRIFFYRVCGTGMGAAACLLKEAGFTIEGADSIFSPPMSDYLESTGIPLLNLDELSQDFLKNFDLIVVGNVVPKGSSDAKLIESLGVPYCSFPSALGELVLKDKNVIGIAGTHGKTTTTYFMTQIFENLGDKPGYFIGGVIPNRPSSRLGESNRFFIESDEYDSAYFEKISKFRLYHLDKMILTSLEFDHADIFNTIEDIKDEFRFTLAGLKKKVVFDESYPEASSLLKEFQVIEKTPYHNKNSGPFIVEQSSKKTIFDLSVEGAMVRFETNIIGEHNIFNIASCILTAKEEGFEIDKIKKAILSLDLVKRRQELRGYFKGSTIYDDFAHHPRAVKLTLDGIKTKHSDKKIYIIMEPNSATARSNIFQKEFAESLEAADYVIMAKPQNSTSAKNAKDLDCDEIISQISKKGKSGEVVEDLASLEKIIREKSNEDILWLVLSNGTCLGLWKSSFVDEIEMNES